ncbi:fatty acid desaturase [bacterium]|nr:fatty acid desaturase [candidate division CSSED10-310 bacterium]
MEFGTDKTFEMELHRRVYKYFEIAHIPHTATPGVYVKAVLILTCFLTTYVLLMFIADSAWLAIVLAILFGFSLAGIGANLQHDGSHGAFSNHGWINKMMATTMDLIGASSYF